MRIIRCSRVISKLNSPALRTPTLSLSVLTMSLRHKSAEGGLGERKMALRPINNVTDEGSPPPLPFRRSRSSSPSSRRRRRRRQRCRGENGRPGRNVTIADRGLGPWSSLHVVNNTRSAASGADNDRCTANEAEFNGPSSSPNVHAGGPIRSLLMRPPLRQP